MEYVSKNPGLQLIIRDQVIDPRLSQPGRPYITKDVLTVEFGQYGREIRPTVPTGQTDEFGNPKTMPMRHEFGNEMIYADFRGGFIDLEQMIQHKMDQKLWDEEDAELVRQTLEDACDNPRSLFFGDVQRHVVAQPGAPWPTYDDMPEEAIVEFASMAGLLGQALYYENVTRKRESLIKALNEKAEQNAALAAA